MGTVGSIRACYRYRLFSHNIERAFSIGCVSWSEPRLHHYALSSAEAPVNYAGLALLDVRRCELMRSLPTLKNSQLHVGGKPHAEHGGAETPEPKPAGGSVLYLANRHYKALSSRH
jgi:hypothetical protein